MKIRSDYATIAVIDVALYIYILISNFSNPFANSVFIILVLGSTLIYRGDVSILHLPILLIYFGFTYLEFYNVFGIAKSQFITFYTFAFVIRNIQTIFQRNVIAKSRFRIFVFAVLSMLLFLQGEYFGTVKILGVMLFCVYFVSKIEDNEELTRNLSLMLIIVLLSTYLYNLIYVRIFTLPAARLEALEGRYGGTRDANNFAFYSVVAFLLLEYSQSIKSSFKRLLVEIALVIGILLTVSMSGFFSIMLILVMKYLRVGFWKNSEDAHRTQQKIHNLIIGIGIVVFACVFEAVLNPNSLVLKMITRIIQINGNVAIGDFSAATSSRTYLWTYYMNNWESLSHGSKLIGSYNTYASLITSTMASHNTYIDLLMTYGKIGSFFLGIYLILRLLKKSDSQNSILKILIALLVVNITFRSFDVQSIPLFSLLML